jgi:hypothetical protein
VITAGSRRQSGVPPHSWCRWRVPRQESGKSHMTISRLLKTWRELRRDVGSEDYLRFADNSRVIELWLNSKRLIRKLFGIVRLSGFGLLVGDNFGSRAGFTSFRWARGASTLRTSSARC